jgi:hypothetical protein
MESRYYVDNIGDDWYVFDSDVEPNKAISSWSSKEDAQEDCNKKNGK